MLSLNAIPRVIFFVVVPGSIASRANGRFGGHPFGWGGKVREGQTRKCNASGEGTYAGRGATGC